MIMKKVKAFIEQGADGSYGVYIDLDDTSLNYGIYGDGATVNEAKEDFLKAYQDMKTIYENEGKEFIQAKFIFQYDTASFLSYYNQFISLAGLSKLTGINKSQLSHYIQGYRSPSPATSKKIEGALHRLGKELLAASF